MQAIWPLIGAKYSPDLMGAVETPAANTAPVWLVPGKSGLCLVNVEGSGGTASNAGSDCNSATAAAVGELWTIDTIPFGNTATPTKVLLGVAPDGNSTVTVKWADATSSAVPVINNIYDVAIGDHSGFESIVMQGSAGQQLVVPGLAKLP